jgi:hypothetical protein
MSVIADVHYNRLQWYSRKYMIECIAHTRNIHRKKQFDYVNAFIYKFHFVLNNFITTKPS